MKKNIRENIIEKCVCFMSLNVKRGRKLCIPGHTIQRADPFGRGTQIKKKSEVGKISKGGILNKCKTLWRSDFDSILTLYSRNS